MKRAMCVLRSLILLIPLCLNASPQGYLFIIGGGDRPDPMMKRFIALSEGFRSGKIIVFPMASSVPEDVGPGQALQLKNLGAKNVECHILSREEAMTPENTKIFSDIGGVFFSGGVQSRLADVLLDTPIHKRLVDFYESGGVIGGTSAGAAVMCEVMITGDERKILNDEPTFEIIEAENIVTARGFGFIKSAIIDQHFIRRKRHNRLISLMAEHPELLGIGIDESTAVIVNPDGTFDVTGERSVLVYDFHEAKVTISPSREISAYNAQLHILKQGDRFDLKRKVVLND